ncbi:uncharacterized protein L969DRAFT_94261 [Mixia osmundae IAM 14324]|uniref:Uncharacterized protein n=1 Tax=Mixia osmundae (strain CBS 9802 / IAM 14324 / JCM 22182 / KY 12970) TaxID=764103 RepID=G7E8B9_MIXOS|nr:uncharacterized protein L969DRAFT_94261 [Mixia osmundae IAM 14324]KEI39182.1 hypothetical protein L969DRAFT_94261 [Mixia osmundae IAM 14324]GAA99079.1 hypothetical protein E5Q_05768 [Mixia osmundae IAM 14324]
MSSLSSSQVLPGSRTVITSTRHFDLAKYSRAVFAHGGPLTNVNSQPDRQSITWQHFTQPRLVLLLETTTTTTTSSSSRSSGSSQNGRSNRRTRQDEQTSDSQTLQIALRVVWHTRLELPSVSQMRATASQKPSADEAIMEQLQLNSSTQSGTDSDIVKVVWKAATVAFRYSPSSQLTTSEPPLQGGRFQVRLADAGAAQELISLLASVCQVKQQAAIASTLPARNAGSAAAGPAALSPSKPMQHDLIESRHFVRVDEDKSSQPHQLRPLRHLDPLQLHSPDDHGDMAQSAHPLPARSTRKRVLTTNIVPSTAVRHRQSPVQAFAQDPIARPRVKRNRRRLSSDSPTEERAALSCTALKLPLASPNTVSVVRTAERSTQTETPIDQQLGQVLVSKLKSDKSFLAILRRLCCDKLADAS